MPGLACSALFFEHERVETTGSMLTIISGTNRPDNNSVRVARIYSDLLKEAGAEFQILDLRQLPQDFAFNAMYGKTLPEVDRIIDTFIAPVRRFVFIAPEYNGSYPGVLKTFLDCVPPSQFYDKKAALVGVSDGFAGNLRGLDHLTGVLNYLKVDVLSRKPKLSHIGESINGDGALLEERHVSQLKEQVARLLEF